MSTVWKYTEGCAKQYRFALDVYLITVLSSSYVIITYCTINGYGHGKNATCALNATEKYLKEQM